MGQQRYTTETTLYMGPWYRRSPYFEGTVRAGAKAYDVYNHTLLPGYYVDPDEEYRMLLDGVVVWDVGAERTIEVSGPDADRLIDMITCRDLTKCAVGQGKYMLVTAADGGIVNDPVLLHVAEDRWWMQLADSDAGLYALGIATGLGLDVEVKDANAWPMQVQGPKAGETLARLVGPGVYDLKYYWCGWFDAGDIPVLISRTGFTALPGFEVNVLDHAQGDALWNAVLEAGEPFGARVAAPSMARRVEAGMMNYGSDMTIENNPFELMGLERLVEEQPQDYVGKEALERIRREGVTRKLVGIEFRTERFDIDPADFWPAFHDGREVGEVTECVWSPRLERNIGYVWVPIELAEPGTELTVESQHGTLEGTTAAIPFIDPRKQVPAAPLQQTG
ncbi:MAG TPA: glycine cleavage T C-terminal barrel domain-containing protein [Actinomycetota bacterium]|nr:glycine cleavage T C-terminal barrel domain-containing protein [Actinomycetota bacterium]